MSAAPPSPPPPPARPHLLRHDLLHRLHRCLAIDGAQGAHALAQLRLLRHQLLGSFPLGLLGGGQLVTQHRLGARKGGGVRRDV